MGASLGEASNHVLMSGRLPSVPQAWDRVLAAQLHLMGLCNVVMFTLSVASITLRDPDFDQSAPYRPLDCMVLLA